MSYSEESWIGEYKKCEAYWEHDWQNWGNPARPHALLTKGGHSSGFFFSGLVTENPEILDPVADSLIYGLLLEMNLVQLGKIDRVVGPAMGAITLANRVARFINQRTSKPCLTSFTEKLEIDGETSMVFNKSRIISGEQVLLVEDVITSGGSVKLTANAVEDAGGIVLPVVLSMVNRSGFDHVDNRKIVALVSRDLPVWTPEDCPLCALGSEAIRPKDGNGANWDRLNADYPEFG